MEYLVLYNSKACSGKGLENAKAIEEKLQGESITYVDACQIGSYDEYFKTIDDKSRVILCGGDGTIGYYVNNTSEETKKIPVDYFPAGTGNDFAHDINGGSGEIIKDVNQYFQNLPTVTINGKSSKFFNGVGYGIDGYCCEVGDMEREKSDKPVNYTGIAIKGLLFHFKSRTATVTIDGKETVFDHVWLTPTMKGRMYGGGMIPTPAQNREDPDGKLSVMVYQAKTALGALIVFPKIFKGEHVKKTNVVTILTGKEITVKFDKPCAAQIDGETVLNVSECTVKA